MPSLIIAPIREELAAAGEPGSFARCLAAAAALGSAFALMTFGGIGLGDVKLAPTLGALLGWHNWTTVLFGTFAMFALGAAVNLLQGRTRGRIAFGPYMIIGALGVSICVSWPSGDGRNVTRLVSDPAPRPCRVDADDCALLGQVADLARSLDAAADDSTASVIL